MKNAVIFLAVAASLVLGSCVRERCSEFPLEIQQSYFPYSDGQMMAFIGGEGDTIVLNVSATSRSSAYNIYGTVKQTCENNMRVEMRGKVDSIGIIMAYYIYTHRYQGDPIGGPKPYNLIVRVESSDPEISDSYYGFFGEDITSDKTNNLLWPFPDTLYLTSIRPNPILDSLIVVKDRGLVSFRLANGQKYQLADIDRQKNHTLTTQTLILEPRTI